jgi:hypothetical protein
MLQNSVIFTQNTKKEIIFPAYYNTENLVCFCFPEICKAQQQQKI